MSWEHRQPNVARNSNVLHNEAPITSVAQRDFKVEEQNNEYNTNIQAQYVSYYSPLKPMHRKGRFTMVPASMTLNPYIGNVDLGNRIANAMKVHSRLAVWGLGGIGSDSPNLTHRTCAEANRKSRLSAHLAELAMKNDVDHVFWISGKSAANFNSDMADAAARLGSERLGSNISSTAAAAVKRWMEAENDETWLLVVDDAGPEAMDGNDHNMVTDSKGENFGWWIPRSSLKPRRTVLITTSNRPVAQRWCADDAIFLMPPLNCDDAVKLLRDQSGDFTSSDSNAKRLVNHLEQHPSAITAAAAYIRHNNLNGMSIDQYLVEFDQGRSAATPPAQGFSRLFLFNARCNSITTPMSPFLSWIKTFTAIETTNRKSLDLLALICCFDQVRISPNLFSHAFPFSTFTAILQDLSILLNYNIITRDPLRKTYAIPRLVQQVARQWFESNQSMVPPRGPSLKFWRFRALNCIIKEYERRKAQPGRSSVEAHLHQCRLLPHINEFRVFCKAYEGEISLKNPEGAGIISFASLYMSEGENRYAESLLWCVLRQTRLDPLLRAVAKVDLAENLRSRSAQDGNKRRLKKATDLVRDARDLIIQEIKEMGDDEEESVVGHVESILYSQIYPCFARLYSDRANFERAGYFQDLVVSYYSTNGKENNLPLLDAIIDRSGIYW